MSPSPRSIWSKVFRIGVGATAIGYVIWKTWEDRETLVQTWENLDGTGIALILLAVVMVVPNLMLEAEKWRLMIKPHYPTVKRGRAILAVLAGMATGIFTPNRIGEYAGRILYLEPGHRVEAMVGTFIDRISQLAVTLLSGVFVLATMNGGDGLTTDMGEVSVFLGNTLFFVAVGTLFLIATFLVFPQTIAKLIPRFLLKYKWIQQVKEGASTIQLKSVAQVFVLSSLRYLVFSSQYVLLLYAMGWPADLQLAYALVALVFLAKSVVPVPGILELGVRETIALEVFAIAELAPAAAVQSTFLLYLINILLPTLLGIAALRGLRLWGKKKEVAE